MSDIVQALRLWGFTEITDHEAILEIAIDKVYDLAVLTATRMKGTRTDFEPLEIHGRVLVWTSVPRRWWLSPVGWTPQRGRNQW